jgi:hypothetical protein
MAKSVKIAFDLDGVIVDKPPLIPKKVLEWLFRGNVGHQLHYRFPGTKIEQIVRKLSHFYLLRPPIRENIAFVNEIARKPEYELYIVSGRYSFLKPETEKWLEKRKINHLFKMIYLNLTDDQPHLFKERKLKELKADIFVDDDEVLCDYLAQKLKATKIFCFNPRSGKCRIAISIKSLGRLLK